MVQSSSPKRNAYEYKYINVYIYIHGKRERCVFMRLHTRIYLYEEIWGLGRLGHAAILPQTPDAGRVQVACDRAKPDTLNQAHSG